MVGGRLEVGVDAARIGAVDEQQLHLRRLAGAGGHVQRPRPLLRVQVVGVGAARQQPQRRLQVGRPHRRVQLPVVFCSLFIFEFKTS